MRNAGYTDVERGERGSTEEHLTVTQFKVQAEQQRLEAMKTGQVAQAERGWRMPKMPRRNRKRNWKLCKRKPKQQRPLL